METNAPRLNIPWLSAWLIILLAGMWICPWVPQLDLIARWQDPNHKITVRIFQFISDSISYISFGVPLITTIVLQVKKNGSARKNWLSLLYVVLSIAIGGLISRIIKETTEEPRPYEIDPRIAQLSVGGGYSLPSGHTTEAFASALAMALLFPRWFVVAPLFLWASLVATSRIYLGVHYPFDIWVGAFIGSLVAFTLFYFVFQQFIYRQPKPAQ